MSPDTRTQSLARAAGRGSVAQILADRVCRYEPARRGLLRALDLLWGAANRWQCGWQPSELPYRSKLVCHRPARAREAVEHARQRRTGRRRPLRTAAAPSGSSLKHTLRRAMTTRTIPVQRHRTRPKARGRRPHSLFSPVRSLRTFCTCSVPTFARTSETARIITSSTSSTRRTTPSTLATLRTPLARHSNASGSCDVRRATHGASGP